MKSSVSSKWSNNILSNRNNPTMLKAMSQCERQEIFLVFPTRVLLEVPFHKKFQIFTSLFKFGIKTEGEMLALPLGKKFDFPKSFSNKLG